MPLAGLQSTKRTDSLTVSYPWIPNMNCSISVTCFSQKQYMILKILILGCLWLEDPLRAHSHVASVFLLLYLCCYVVWHQVLCFMEPCPLPLQLMKTRLVLSALLGSRWFGAFYKYCQNSARENISFLKFCKNLWYLN